MKKIEVTKKTVFLFKQVKKSGQVKNESNTTELLTWTFTN